MFSQYVNFLPLVKLLVCIIRETFAVVVDSSLAVIGPHCIHQSKLEQSNVLLAN